MPLNQQDRDELAALGIIYVEAPPDSWVYRQGTVFFISDQVADEPQAAPARPPLPRLPPDDPIYQSGAWVLFPSGEQDQSGQDDTG